MKPIKQVCFMRLTFIMFINLSIYQFIAVLVVIALLFWLSSYAGKPNGSVNIILTAKLVSRVILIDVVDVVFYSQKLMNAGIVSFSLLPPSLPPPFLPPSPSLLYT